MMRKLILIYLFSIPGLSMGQYSDTLHITKKIDSLLNISHNFTTKHDFKKALLSNEKAQELAIKSFGHESIAYGRTCFNLGNIYYEKEEFPLAEKWYLNSIAIYKSKIESADYASVLNNLANLYVNLGEFEKAEPLIQQSISLREKIYGKQHAEYASGLSNLAILYHNLSQFEKAESLFLEAKNIRSLVHGKEHPLYADVIYNLSIVYQDMGIYEKAESLGLEAKIIREKVIGKEHLDYVWSLNSLGLLNVDLGNFKKAEELYLEAKGILENTLGIENLDYAENINNLAILYDILAMDYKAEPLYLKANEIWENLLGKENPTYANSLFNLASLYKDLGNIEKAELLLLESKAIWENIVGKEHPGYANILNNIGILYTEIGLYKKAKSFLLENEAIRQKTLGKEHRDYAWSLSNLAKVSEYLREFENTDAYEKEYLQLAQALLANSILFLSEREISLYNNTLKDLDSEPGSFLISRLKKGINAGILPELIFDQSLFQKGFVLNAAYRLNNLPSFSPETQALNKQLKDYKRRLASEFSRPIGERKSVIELEEKSNTTEKELARLVFGLSDAKRQVKWKEVENVLRLDEAAIEFIHFNITFPRPSDSILYAALIIKPGIKQPIFVPLFEEKQLKKLLSQKRDQQNKEQLAQIYSRGASPITAMAVSEGLYSLCWMPLDSLLTGVKKVYYSPSGLFHQVNFDAIPVSENVKLSDRYNLIRLSSTRSLVVQDLNKVNANNEAVLFGGIQYELDTMQFNLDSTKDLGVSKTTEISFNFVNHTSQNRGGNWNYLPGTEKEVNQIASILTQSKYPFQIFQGKIATEERFKNLGREIESPRILHVATHGFFFPDVKDTTHFSKSLREPAFKNSEHPMIRSGLLLTGANLTWKTGKPWKDGVEDGILTAYEISQMNLSNTELVVLSACETGLGDIQGNEGVYGLQRAFKIAGVKYLIMSLWQVPDKQTSMLMITFYKKWLEEKMSIPDAFHAAQKELREIGLDPYQWAGFVLIE